MMPNRYLHEVVGTGSGGTAGYLTALNEQDPLLETVMAAIGGYWGGRLPDIIEPASNPNHRQSAHSFVMATSLVEALRRLNDWRPETQSLVLFRSALIGLITGYLIRLALDGVTPKGLPIY